MLENWSVFAGSLEHIYSIPPVAVCWCVRELCVRELGESKVCVRESCARGAGEGGADATGVHNQTQEPHTKMWGTA